MSKSSIHLDNILVRHNRTANLQVVFLDIEKYSKRSSFSQISVIDAFTKCVKDAIIAVSKEFIDYAQKNNINFDTDIISLPTGDGSAVVFSFDGLHEIHLKFATSVLERVYAANRIGTCDKFEEQGWCNCHQFFNVRIGVSEGRGILYKDVNDNYNVAGEVINMAARAMPLADKNQIVFTEAAFRQIVDMVNNPDLVDCFVAYENIEIKHKIKITVYHYRGCGEEYMNVTPPKNLSALLTARELQKTMKNLMSAAMDSGFEGEPVFDQNMMVQLMNVLTPKPNDIKSLPALPDSGDIG